ncbi:hypothetical protein GCM10027040_07840 [Halomonas shantousis]
MSHLSERAEAVQAWLEGDWTLHRRQPTEKGRRQEDKRWRSQALVAQLWREGICPTGPDGWEALHELAGAGVIETEALTSLRQRPDVLVCLSEALRHRLESEFAEPDGSLGLDVAQAAVWRHVLDGVLQDWSLQDQQRLADGLRALAANLPAAYALSTFGASARYLLGSSRLLTALPRELVRSFGIDTMVFRGPMAWVLTAMPAKPEGVLWIEHPQSFDRACRVGLDKRLALVCSFDHGASLDEALQAPERVRLMGGGASWQTLDELLALPNVTFWGDLDSERLGFFQRLRQTVPGIRLSALYAPMIERLEAGGGYPLHALTGKTNRRHVGARSPGHVSRGLDQEVLDDASLIELAGQPLDETLAQRWLSTLSEYDEVND